MKPPYEQRESELRHCPNCESQNHEKDYTHDRQEGCTDCVKECGYCGYKVFDDELEPGYLVIKRGRWTPVSICSYCREEMLDQDDIREDLFHTLHTNLKPE